MNLFELFVKVGVDDQASGKLNNIADKVGKGLATAAKVGTAAIAAAATGIAALTTESINSYAEYEQLVGGVETLFKDSADAVKKYADEAYRSAGLSANDYMSTVTSFSASLLQSLGRGAQTDLEALKENLDEQYDLTKKNWDDRIALAKKMKKANVQELADQRDAELKALKKTAEQKLAQAEAANNRSVVTAETRNEAARLANQTIIDMADNVAKMGVSMESVQDAYRGFSKETFNMLDNLALGYKGSTEEAKRLVKDAAAMTDIQEELGITIDANSLSFDNFVQAIHVVQTSLGIAGTTAKEAGTTIEGSITSMKAAWTNLLTGFGNSEADLSQLVDNLVTSLVGDGTDTNLGVLGNVLPAVERILGGISEVLRDGLPKIASELPSIIQEVLPTLLEAASGLIQSVASMLPSFLSALTDDILPVLLANLIAAFDSVIAVLPSVLESLIGGVSSLFPIVLSAAVKLVESIAKVLPKLLKELDIKTLVLSIADSLEENLPVLVEVLLTLLTAIIEVLPELTLMLSESAGELAASIWSAVIKSIPALLVGLKDVIFELGKQLPKLLAQGLLLGNPLGMLFVGASALIKRLFGVDLYGTVKDAIKELWEKLIDFLKDFPPNFKDIGKNIVEGLWEGIKGSWTWIEEKVDGAFGGLVKNVKDVLGIKSPSRVFRDQIGKQMAYGLGIGWEDAFGDVDKDIRDSLNYSDASFGFGAYGSYSRGSVGGSVTTFGTVNINIEGYNAQDDDELAEMIAEKLQVMTERKGAVFA